MPIDITKIAQQYTSPVTEMTGPGSAIQALLAQQERWRKQLLGPSYPLQTIRDHLSVQEQFMDQHRKLIASSLSFGINDLIQRTLRVGELANVLGQSSATLELIEQNRRLMDQMTRIFDPFQDMRDRLKLDQVHPWASQIAAAAEHARELLESLPAQAPGDDEPDWDALEDQLQSVQASIARLPLTGATHQELRAMGFSRADWVVLFLTVACFILDVLGYLEARAQGQFSRDQATQEQAEEDRAAQEEREFRERLLGAIEALGEHSPGQHGHYVVGNRVVRVKSAITGGLPLDTAHPNQLVLVTDKHGRWLKIRYRNHLEDREVEGWVLKHYLIRKVPSAEPDSEE